VTLMGCEMHTGLQAFCENIMERDNLKERALDCGGGGGVVVSFKKGKGGGGGN